MSFTGLIPEGIPAPRPGVCVCCGNDRRPLATTGREIVGYGTVLVCVGTTAKPGCLLQVAAQLGCLMPGKAEKLAHDNAKTRQQVEALTLALQHKSNGLDPVIEVVPVDAVVELLAERLGIPEPVK